MVFQLIHEVTIASRFVTALCSNKNTLGNHPPRRNVQQDINVCHMKNVQCSNKLENPELNQVQPISL